ncbi:MAG: hypothetical protein JWO63_1153 [Frankiales bacterium]|nr:hypothetical protein [Frankiales bacterium]
MTLEPDEVGYLRGAQAARVDRKRVSATLVALLAITLLTLVIVLTFQAVTTNLRLRELRAHGTPVQATVTGCVGMASGTGITAAGFSCRGSFQLDGRSHNATIRGTDQLYPPGQSVAAVADRVDPTVLYLGTDPSRFDWSWRVFLAPAICLLCLLCLCAGLAWRRWRSANSSDAQ